MCGINGFNFKNQELILKMNQLTAHRGPDQTDFWLGDNASLGHNRLSIIDLSEKARQPMWDSERQLAIVYNGEIYNFQELRAELEKKYQFQSQSDTEVILYAYKEYGVDCLNKFNGIFAFAIWDARKNELFLARDRMGIKPLYYYFEPSTSSGQAPHQSKHGTGQARFIFSSEIKAILAHDVPRAVEPAAFNFYFHVFYVPEPQTMFAGIKKLPAASWLRLRGPELTVKKYWQVEDFSDLSSKEEAENKISHLFADAVKRQLVSDRPVGVFLSGGIDSTAVLGAVRDSSSDRVKTFSVGFDVKMEEEKFNADFLLARETAKHYATDHHELIVRSRDILDNLEKIAWHLDEPNFNPTAGAIFLLAREAKQKVAVVLGGDGGDELFGGYPRYYFSRLISLYQKLPARGRQLVDQAIRSLDRAETADKLGLPPDASRVLAFLSAKPPLLNQVIAPERLNGAAIHEYFQKTYFLRPPTSDFEKHFMNLDRQSWLMDESFLRTDKMTMAAGLEERVPILDYRLVELANRLPTSWKLNVWRQTPGNFQGKMIWKKAIGKYLLPHVLEERKRGWFTPMAKWLRDEPLKSLVSEILSPANLQTDYFNAAGVQRIWQDHLSGQQYNLNIIWAIVMWQLWHSRFIKK